MMVHLEILKRKIIFPYFYLENGVSVIPDAEFKSLYPNAYDYLSRHKDVLSERDKGNGKYREWFAYGRGQGLEKYKFKLLFPHISPVIPNYVLTDDSSLLFRNGLALLSDDENILKVAKKLMQSRLFWFYITNTSKPYGSGYFSLSRNYLKSFGIYEFTDEQKNYLIHEDDRTKVDVFLERLYGVNLSV
jgi:adenine-specific DNA-methyltransferase